MLWFGLESSGVLDLKLYGVVISVIVFSLLMCALNWLSISRYLSYRQEIRRTFIVPLISSAIMGVVVFVVYIILKKIAGNILSTTISIIVGAIAYFVALLLLHGVKEEEIRSFPGGDILAEIAISFKLL